MTKRTTIAISESFYSIQGEGPYSGLPAVFCRLKGCNLRCGGPTTLTSKKIEAPATWRCDTMEVWTEGISLSIEALIQQWKKDGFLDRLLEGARLIITGGEPLLQQPAIVHLLETLTTTLNKTIPVEIETNGTIHPIPALQEHECWYNCSPKLHSSGTCRKDRLIPEAIHFFSRHDQSCFKWVISNEEDITEIIRTFIEPFKIDPQKAYLMPASSTKQQYLMALDQLIPYVKHYGFKLSPRLHLQLWDQKTGI